MVLERAPACAAKCILKLHTMIDVLSAPVYAYLASFITWIQDKNLTTERSLTHPWNRHNNTIHYKNFLWTKTIKKMNERNPQIYISTYIYEMNITIPSVNIIWHWNKRHNVHLRWVFANLLLIIIFHVSLYS